MTLFGFNLSSTCIGSPFHAGFSLRLSCLLAALSNFTSLDGLCLTFSNSCTSRSARKKRLSTVSLLSNSSTYSTLCSASSFCLRYSVKFMFPIIFL